MKGRLSIVLHAHLPFVRHPEHENFLEEDWLYEAISETYLPLLIAFDRLAHDGVPFRLTMTLTPTLVAMLRDDLLMSRYARRLDSLCELADKEIQRTAGDLSFHPVACFYRERFAELRSAFLDRYQGDLVSAFRSHQAEGRLEIITCGATHGFLPLMQDRPEAVRAQIAVAANNYRLTFGANPPGIWLPECGYYPGVEKVLAREGIGYFFVDTHGLMDATPRPLYGVYAPVYTEAGVAAFARDPDSSRQVWAKEVGYPGDARYREFYRDLGWDLPLDDVRPYIQPTGGRKNTGFKYYRITGVTQDKQPYVREDALAAAKEHAADFLQNRIEQARALQERMGKRVPVIVSPYDAELFGHWWFEGPDFLEALIRAAAEQDEVVLSTPGDELRANPENQVATPATSSWGEEGYARMWLDEGNDWIYPHLDAAAGEMIRLAADFHQPDELHRRALNQAARELLLAQSSDWAFIIKTGTMVEYAVKRTREHLLRFRKLSQQLWADAIEEPWLSYVEAKDNVFPEIDYRVYRP